MDIIIKNMIWIKNLLQNRLFTQACTQLNSNTDSASPLGHKSRPTPLIDF